MNYAFLWDHTLCTFNSAGHVVSEMVEGPEQIAELIAARYQKGAVGLIYDGRDFSGIIEANFVQMATRAKTREAIRVEQPTVGSSMNGWGYEKAWLNGGSTEGILYIDQGTTIHQLDTILGSRKIHVSGAWPLLGVALASARKLYGAKQTANHFALFITTSGVAIAGEKLTGEMVYHKATAEVPGIAGVTGLWEQVRAWLENFVGILGDKPIGATLDVYYSHEDVNPAVVWEEWGLLRGRVKCSTFASLLPILRTLSTRATNNLIADFPRPIDLSGPMKIAAVVALVAAGIIGGVGYTRVSDLRTAVRRTEEQVNQSSKTLQVQETNREEINRLMSIYGPGVVMTDEGRGSILTTLSRRSNKIIPDGVILQSVNITEDNHCIIQLVMPFSTSKEIEAKAKLVLASLQKAHEGILFRAEKQRIDASKMTVTIDGEYKY